MLAIRGWSAFPLNLPVLNVILTYGDAASRSVKLMKMNVSGRIKSVYPISTSVKLAYVKLRDAIQALFNRRYSSSALEQSSRLASSLKLR